MADTETKDTVPLLMKLHGAFMMIAWIFLAGLSTTLSRNFQDWLPDRKMLGSNVWFQVHKTCGMMILGFTTSGLLCIFYLFDFEFRNHPHSYTGLFLVGLTLLQVILGVCHPKRKSKYRGVFRYAHLIQGFACRILSACAVFFVYDLTTTKSNAHKTGYTFMIIWVIAELVWFEVFEFLRNRYRRRLKLAKLESLGTFSESEITNATPSVIEEHASSVETSNIQRSNAPSKRPSVTSSIRSSLSTDKYNGTSRVSKSTFRNIEKKSSDRSKFTPSAITLTHRPFADSSIVIQGVPDTQQGGADQGECDQVDCGHSEMEYESLVAYEKRRWSSLLTKLLVAYCCSLAAITVAGCGSFSLFPAEVDQVYAYF